MRFPASARLPCCVHAPAAISVLPSKPPAPSRRIPARACDSSLPALICLLQPPPRVCPARTTIPCILQLHSSFPAPLQPPACSAHPYISLPAAPAPKHRGSHSSKAPQPEVRGGHSRCSHSRAATHLKLGGQHSHIFLQLLSPALQFHGLSPFCVLTIQKNSTRRLYYAAWPTPGIVAPDTLTRTRQDR